LVLQGTNDEKDGELAVLSKKLLEGEAAMGQLHDAMEESQATLQSKEELVQKMRTAGQQLQLELQERTSELAGSTQETETLRATVKQKENALNMLQQAKDALQDAHEDALEKVDNLEEEKERALAKEQKAMAAKEKLMQEGEESNQQNLESSHMAVLNNKRMHKQLQDLKEKNQHLEEEVEQLQKQLKEGAKSGNGKSLTIMEGVGAAEKKLLGQIKELEDLNEDNLFKLSAEANKRLEVENELKKLKGEPVAPSRRSARAKRGALEPVDVPPAGTNSANIQVEEQGTNKVQKQNENLQAQQPIRRSLRQAKSKVASTGEHTADTTGEEEAAQCKQQ